MKYNHGNFLSLVRRTRLAQSEENHSCFELCNTITVGRRIQGKLERQLGIMLKGMCLQ